MAFTTSGLPGSPAGYTSTGQFRFNYEDTLSAARGKDLVTAVMPFAEADLRWLKSFLSGQYFNPLNGLNVHFHQRTQPTDPLGASWQGLGLVPFNIEVWLGEVPILGIAPVAVARMLLIAEISEMLMRDSNLPGTSNPWFGHLNEGNKGEALSRVFGIEFLRTHVPGTTTTGFASVSSVWLDSPPRDDKISTNSDDIGFDATNGCGTLFLMFLHDELGFSLDQIIANGATETPGFPSSGTLPFVFQSLTGQPASDAFMQFVDLVNLHYPLADGPYGAPMDTVFPVTDLARLDTESPRLTWGVSNGPPSRLHVVMSKPTVVPTTVHLSSSDPGVLPVPATFLVFPPSDAFAVPLPVTPQPAAFVGEVVTLTVTYAGRTLTYDFTVVRPEDLLPPLEIVAHSDDLCARLFEEQQALTFRIDNIAVFRDRMTLTYVWSVKGAAVATGALDQPVLEILSLPPAGTALTVSVSVTNEDGLTGHGTLDFTVLAPLAPLEELVRRVRCKMATAAEINRYIPPWVPIEEQRPTVESIIEVRRQLRAERAKVTDLDKELHQLEIAIQAQERDE